MLHEWDQIAVLSLEGYANTSRLIATKRKLSALEKKIGFTDFHPLRGNKERKTRKKVSLSDLKDMNYG